MAKDRQIDYGNCFKNDIDVYSTSHAKVSDVISMYACLYSINFLRREYFGEKQIDILSCVTSYKTDIYLLCLLCKIFVKENFGVTCVMYIYVHINIYFVPNKQISKSINR